MPIPWSKRPPVQSVPEHFQHIEDEQGEPAGQSGGEAGENPAVRFPSPGYLEIELDDFS